MTVSKITPEMIAQKRNEFAIEPHSWRKTPMLFYRGDKPQSVEDAFLITLAKWDILRSQEGPEIAHDNGAHSCGLCRFFGDCRNCPIGFDVGKSHCSRTPWADYQRAQEQNDFAAARKSAEEEYQMIWDLYILYTTGLKLDLARIYAPYKFAFVVETLGKNLHR